MTMRMMRTIEKLSVHRNTCLQRKAKKARKDLMRAARDLANTMDIAGFAIVVWNKDWGHRTKWDAAKTMPGNVVPEFVKRAILRDAGRDDARDILADSIE